MATKRTPEGSEAVAEGLASAREALAEAESAKPGRKRKAAKPAPKRKRVAKRFTPTDEQRAHVQRLKLVGQTDEVIADILGISQDTLVRHFDYELRLSKADLIANVGATLYQKAIGGDTAACMFYLKTQAGWRETERKELTGPDGKELPAGFSSLPPLVLVEYVDSDGEGGIEGGGPA